MARVARDVTLTNWLDAPFNRRSFLAVREVVPTALIPRGDAVIPLPVDPQPLDDIEFRAADGSMTTLARHLEANYADGVCVLHRGRVVYERYLNGLRPEMPHLLMSVSKSFCGTLCGVLAGQGLIDPDGLVTDHAPDLAGTSLDGATVRHLLDMTAGTEFVEDYDLYEEPGSDHPLIEYERQAGYRPLGDRVPVGVIEFFGGLPRAQPHGAVFDYRSPLTNMLAYVMEEVTGTPYPELLSRELFARLGPEHDAEVMLDPCGFPVVEGGMCCTLRDLARLGLLIQNRGRVGGDQVLPEAWVDDLLDPPAASRAAWAAAPADATHGAVGYRSSFWTLEPGVRATGWGIFGQMCLVDLEHELVFARFSSAPEPVSADRRAETARAVDAILEHLG